MPRRPRFLYAHVYANFAMRVDFPNLHCLKKIVRGAFGNCFISIVYPSGPLVCNFMSTAEKSMDIIPKLLNKH